MMLMQATKRRTQSARGYALPAPIGGWNAKDPLAGMKPTEAVLLDNWFPEASKVTLRNGFASHGTGMGSTTSVESLMAYSSGGTQKLLAAAGTKIWDVTTAGAATAKASSLTNARWQHVMHGERLCMVNGADLPKQYNGSAVSNMSLSGATLSSMIGIASHQQRLWMIEKNTLSAYYLPANAISGLLTEVDLTPYCKLGGTLSAIGTWTRDGGDGPDDLIVYLTSEGQAVIFAGTNPASATTWSLIGVFEVGKPLGRRCLVKVGADLIAITEDGFLRLSQVLSTGRANAALALSDKIQTAVNAATRMYESNHGWQAVLYAHANMAIFNVPLIEKDTAHQYVVNTQTGAWARFKGMDANCWATLGDDLFFGGNDGVVYQADSGGDDNGAEIAADGKQAFSYLGAPGLKKQFMMVRPVLASAGGISPAVEINTDFADRVPSATPTTVGGEGPPWDTTDWDVSDWGNDAEIAASWVDVSGIGYSVSLRIRVASETVPIYWLSSEWIYKPAGLGP